MLSPRILTSARGCLAKAVDGATRVTGGKLPGLGVTGAAAGVGGVSEPQLPGATKTGPEASGGSQASGAEKGVPSIASRAPTASTSPPPTAQGPKAPTAAPLAASAPCTAAGEEPGLSSNISAATPAAWGAAAEVPQKRQTPEADLRAKKVVPPQSVAATSGLETTSGEGSAGAGAVPSTGPK